FLVFDGF
ncbi:hypothetical protein D043_5169, partial [Vibrio parahaemolyticus EKP-021]